MTRKSVSWDPGRLDEKFREDLGRLVGKGSKVVAAVSGGPDSMVLLHLLLRVKEGLDLDLVAAHLDHGLRGAEGERDRKAVMAAAGSWGVPFIWDRTDCRRRGRATATSIEEAAREARYEFLEKVRRETGSRHIATGHTADDQAESVLINLLRGSGPKGLSGMPAVRGAIVRPLLNIERKEIIRYLHHNHLSWVEDSTNQDRGLTRNRVRLDLIPKIEKDFNPRIKAGLIKMARIFRDEEAFWEKAIGEAKTLVDFEIQGERVSVRSEALARLDPALARRVVRAAVEIISGSTRSLEFDHVDTVLHMAVDPEWKAADLPRGIRIWKEDSRLCIGYRPPAKIIAYRYPLPVPGWIEIREIGRFIQAEISAGPVGPDFRTLGSSQAVLDMDRLALPLTVRSPLPGDRFRPLGMQGRKKLSDFFIDAKVPAGKRPATPLVVDGSGEIVWVGGHRPAESVKVHGKTERTLCLTLGDRADKDV